MASRFIAIAAVLLLAQSAKALDLGIQAGMIHTAYSHYYDDKDGPLLLLTAGSPLSTESIVRLGVTVGIWSQHYTESVWDFQGDYTGESKTTLPGYILGANLIIDNRTPRGTHKPTVRPYTGIGSYWTTEKQEYYRDDSFWKDMLIVEALGGLAIPATAVSDILVQFSVAEEISKSEKREGDDNIMTFTIGYRFRISDSF